MKKNDIYEIEITGMTHDGMGVGRVDGMAVFVQRAIEGEKVVAKIIKVTKNYAVARIEEWITTSPERTEPFCPVYKRCGGCSLQHMSYNMQLKFKHRVVTDNLERIGGFWGIQVSPVIGMDNPMNYRNKAQYPVGMGDNGPVAGFYARRSHIIIDSERCGIQHPASEKVKNTVLEAVKELKIPVYNEITGEGILRHIVTRVSYSTGDVMVILVVTDEKVPGLKKIIQKITREIPEVISIVLNINKRRDNVILGDKVRTVYGSDTLVDRLGHLKFHISPLSFYQVNPVQTVKLYNKAVEFAGLTGNETVFDLYCGIGTISLFLAEKAKEVIGVEVVPEAVEAATKNAVLNNISNARFYCGEAEKVVPELYNEGIRADVVVVDPPRKGCDEALLQTVVKMQPERIVYVSCNPSTLARDLKYLAANGYNLDKVHPVDLFPWTEHVETVVLMSKVKNQV
ncbi:23S rRNA (uracil-5-)-methyltransferase RumA [Thermoclostridium stercorarium subsp. stercorarium DSM 8532]|uniref:23S rRNA (Uracil-5-)-methyltransferase RumA n=2 Tax=Thermoclostridium stercorarium TaxID=1510 RepID=L7VR98_THES1|nr:23S rRNA (uracil(1939)-C(5))-methyltransferase RlmD [Thermoclostridium stercorarium]AGC68931.1 23S rRNA (uracil-5-)-methyltransferase RumA [Thermoclostridium stercorarium subsp. stercorarium DSM 8532]AGI39914.1 23S rRNA methyltransferase [Thermoclostridium stercorarium subsp. stercorarium DSM 8532]ANW99235.1 23S rRNA (uracil-5-)-methyltransferase RumA [Thermoclostridium stercorarium subsp. thermolacticum DSM 2910]UZQ84912.1 23S rRNA (uracil(1939)-C(5))-methyltransferase RlmD [Thermoclostridi